MNLVEQGPEFAVQSGPGCLYFAAKHFSLKVSLSGYCSTAYCTRAKGLLERIRN